MKSYYEKNHKINLKVFEEYITQLKVMAHPVRYAIIVILATNKKMTVTEIYDELSIQQAAASNHLKILKTHKLLLSKRMGKNMYYSVNHKAIKKLLTTLDLGADGFED